MHTGRNNWGKRVGAVLVVVLVFVMASQSAVSAAGPTTAAEITAGAAEGACLSGGVAGLPCPAKGALNVAKTTKQDIHGPASAFAVLTIATNVLDFFANRVAYEVATAIATAGPGGQPLIVTKPLADYWPTMGLDVAGEVIGSLDEQFPEKFGAKFSVCAPPNPLLRANLAIGIQQAYQPKKPKCEWANISQNWSASWASVVSVTDNPTGKAMEMLAQSLRPGSNELSFAIQTTIATNDLVNTNRYFQTQDAIKDGGFKSITDVVTGQIKTPASLIEDATKTTFAAKDQSSLDRHLEFFYNTDWAELGAGIGFNMLNTFVNTLLSTGIQTLKEGIIPISAPTDPFSGEVAFTSDVKEQLAARFAGIKTARPFSTQPYDVLTEFITCPTSSGLNRGPNNCVMDNSFAAAITRGSTNVSVTVRQAIDPAQGFLDPNWKLIAADDPRNQDPQCYTFAFCHGNLVKMRKANIIPVGWEIAATKDKSGTPYTLGEVVAAFDDCKGNPEICHLIDPDWILKYPESQCRATVNGEILSAKNIASRSSVCADVTSCVSERADGSCAAYGYCTKEKNVWRFQGESCPAQFASCMSFTNRAGNKAASFLLNTVNYATCSDANAGCLWYALTKAVNNNGTPTVTADDRFEWAGGEDKDTEKRLYLNGKAKQCSSAEAGCTELYVADNLRLNLVANGDLETDENKDSVPDAWYWDGATAGQYVRDSALGFLNSEASVRPSATSKLVQGGIALTPGAFHTFSAHMRGTNTGDAVQVSLVRQDGVTPAVLTGTNFSNNTCSRSGNTYVIAVSNGSADEYRRYTCTFSVPTDAAFAVVRLVNDALTYDAVQIEVGELATSFIREGYDQPKPSSTYLRVAPAYLGCTGAATDRAECKNYAQSCSAQDVGCSLYRPADGGPSVPATATTADQCPNECVGYAAFKQQGTRYEQAKFPVSFIPTNARACDVQFAGCDSFTNLDAVSRGGESVEYYTSLRACSKPEETTQGRTYFTWEGSDAAGYQLRTWQLLKESNGEAPCTSWEVKNAGTDAAPRPAISCTSAAAVVDQSCNEHADILSNPDCREFYDEAGVISYRLFSKTVTIAAACAPYRKTVSDTTDADGNGKADDCEDTGGLWTAAGECRYLGIAKESNSCPANVNGCRAYTGGAGNNVRTALEETFEPPAFQSADVTAYGGATVVQTSESVATGGHSIGVVNAAAGAGFGGTLEDTVTFGKTYAVDFWAKGNGDVQVAFVQANNVVRNIGTPVRVTGDWKSFSVGPVDTAAFEGFDDRASIRLTLATAGSFYVDYLRMTESQDTFGVVKNSWTIPASCDRGPGVDGTPGTGPAAPQYYLGCKAYTETKSNQTSAFYQFTRLCSENVVGCQAFFDTRNSNEPSGRVYNAVCSTATTATSGTDCKINNISYCTIPTGQRSCTFEYAGAALPRVAGGTFALSFGPDTRIVRNDAAVYLVDNGEASCTEASLGCQEVGKPVFNQDRSQVTAYETAYVFDRPDEYKDTLCAASALFCAAWNTPSNGTYFFKDPGEQTCEYREDVKNPQGISYSGWFKTETNTPCYANNATSAREYGIWRNGDSLYSNWVGSCPATENRCTEYIDPVSTDSNVSSRGKSYYFLQNDKLGASVQDVECNGQISQKAGCILFNGSSELSLKYSASPSYVLSRHADLVKGSTIPAAGLVSPLSCQGDPAPKTFVLNGQERTVDLCARRCRYDVGTADELIGAPGAERQAGIQYTGSCLVNDDCPSLRTATSRSVSGTCADTPTLRHKDDTNMVMPVLRDRQCSEWLACYSSKSTWNSNKGAYDNVCDKVRLCKRLATFGDQNVCVEWVESAPEVLTASVYQKRDTSWNGAEYLGFSIPNQLPVDKYREINLGLNGQSDPRLVYLAGSCAVNAPRGSACSIGACSDNGSSCSSNANCDNNDCVFGYCQAQGGSCNSNTDCNGATPLCDSQLNRCVSWIDRPTAAPVKCVQNAACGGGQVCRPVALAKTGACFNDLCVTDIADRDGNGQPDPVQFETAAAKECRGFPENDSPFPGNVVRQWTSRIKEATNGTVTIHRPGENPLASSAVPYSFVPGYEAVRTYSPTCAEDGTCAGYVGEMCDYTKVTYGRGAVSRYYAPEVRESDFLSGICTGGDLDGAVCRTDKDCTVEETTAGETKTISQGTCQKQTQQQKFVGWSGYCIENDSSIQLFGSQAKQNQACLTWFPTDQTSTSTDLYGKSVEAGFAPQELEYCTAVAPFYDISTSRKIACAEARDESESANNYTKSDAWFDGDNNDGWKSVACPANSFAFIGAAGLNDYCIDTSDADHPYFCVPALSVHTTGQKKGELCTPRDFGQVLGSLSEAVKSRDFTGGAGRYNPYLPIDIFLTDQLEGAMNVYKDCTSYGNNGSRFSDSYYNYTYILPAATTIPVGLFWAWDEGYRNLDTPIKEYLGCSDLVQVSTDNETEYRVGGLPADTASGGGLLRVFNQVWTNRMWKTAAYTLRAAVDNLKYVQDKQPIFGSAVPLDLYQANIVDDQGQVLNPQPVHMCIPSGTDLPPGSAPLIMPAADGRCVQSVAQSDEVDTRPYVVAKTQCVVDEPANASDWNNYAQSRKCQVNVSKDGTVGSLSCSPAESYVWNGTINLDIEGELNEFLSRDVPGVGSTQAYRGTSYTVNGIRGFCMVDIRISAGSIASVTADCNRPTNGLCVSANGETNNSKVVCTKDIACRMVEVRDDTVKSKAQVAQIAASALGKTKIWSDVRTSILAPIFADAGPGVSYRTISQVYADYDTRRRTAASDGNRVIGYTDSTGDALVKQGWDVTAKGDGVKAPTAPTIVSVRECIDQVCKEGTNGYITLGSQDGSRDQGLMISKESSHVDLSFYTYADPDQLPLRRIMVDWGDGRDWSELGMKWPTSSQSGSIAQDNFYPNYRGRANDANGTIICETNKDWGTQDSACDSSYVNFTHDYACSPTFLAKLESQGRTCEVDTSSGTRRLVNSPCTGGADVPDAAGKCVFQPRVHVLDNWGWCTGTCKGGADGTDGCYDASYQALREAREAGLTDTQAEAKFYNECNIENCPGGASCGGNNVPGKASDNASTLINPWINFDGFILVEPFRI